MGEIDEKDLPLMEDVNEAVRAFNAHIQDAYSIRRVRSNDTEMFVQSASQRDVALNMRQPNGLKNLQ